MSGLVDLYQVQSGASSQAKHGGAYFPAVRGSIEDPIAVPGRHESGINHTSPHSLVTQLESQA